jgi:hypothetical protein
MDQLRIKVGQTQLETYRQLIFYNFTETSDSISNNFIASITQEHLYQ